MQQQQQQKHQAKTVYNTLPLFPHYFHCGFRICSTDRYYTALVFI